MSKIEITEHLFILENELEESFVRSGGPGGQNVNKVNTAVQLKFDLASNTSLPTGMKDRARRLAGKRLTKDGVIVLQANSFRTQEQNRESARKRLVDLLKEAAIPPKERKPTKIPFREKQARADNKHKRSQVKKLRGKPKSDE